MDVQIRQRKNDSLVRCSVCFGLRTIMAKATTEEERKEAKRKLDLHFEYISQQKVIIQTMCLQSRDDRFDLSVFLIDGMSNRHTKLPNRGDRPKFVTDSIRVIVCLTTVQVAISQGPYEFTNFDYPSIQSVFSHDSSYVLSLFLDGLSKLKSIPSVITVILDSAPNNKSYVMLGGMGAILARISAIRKIFLLYPSTGHTHMSVDGHFGSLSKSLGSRDLLDPQDFVNFLESCPSVAEVNVAPTIYDFVPVQQHMVKVPNLFSNSQICVSKGDGGKVYWSAASSLHSSILFKTESDENAFPLFKEDFNPTTFSATIRKPEIEPIVKKIDGLFKNSGNLYSEAQKHNFSTFVETYGKKAFRHSITDLNRKQSKLTQPSHPSQVQDPHITVLQYLEKNKYPTGKVPKTPLV
ncbi:hypothetical protein CRE_01494 [Caenorhabditis remanei]|uniref:DUF7869 domain-containing protein n=1 Tax=Caenorhabditis remanei TaxID=31234 RepID=E3NSG7_CAERE|nr:hypothetical protein CRE_01494 [Caenorhabditis remanei]